MRRPRLAEALSWAIWLLGVVVFAMWMHLHYRAPAGPPWIGMTIRTAVFAIWTLTMREWLALRWHNRTRKQPDPHEDDRC
jgi:hypothetical protein